MSSDGAKVLIQNRKARFNYTIIEDYEAGIVLKGSEVKSIKLGNINISESYIRIINNECFLVGAHISVYKFETVEDIDPLRKRKLLLSKKEIVKLKQEIEQKGFTIVPLDVHLRRGKVKLQIGIAKGKKTYDKRESIKERESKMELGRIKKQFNESNN